MHKAVEKKRQIRKIGSCATTGDVYGVTIPKYIKEKFSETFFSVMVSGDNIILASGCKYG